VVKPAVDVTGSNSTADGRVRTLEKIRLAGDIAKRVGAGWVLDCEKENKWYTVDSTTFPRGGGRKSMEPHTLSNNKGSTNGRRSGADWETMEEFMRLSTNTSSNSSLWWLPSKGLPKRQPHPMENLKSAFYTPD